MSKNLYAFACSISIFLFSVAVAPAHSQESQAQELLSPDFYTSIQQDLSVSTVSPFDVKMASCDLGCCEPSCGTDSSAGCGDSVGCGCGVGGKKKAGASGCATSHKVLFFANDFSYLKSTCNQEACLGDALKLMPVAGGDWGTLDVGGQFRLRYHGETGLGREAGAPGLRFQDNATDFMLSRLRLYANWKVSDCVRIYAEGIHAETTKDGGDYIPRGIDRNRGDFLNLFIDLKLTDSLTARVGRQELLYGAQRTVSPLDWANTRRTFEGARLLYRDGNWSSDTFWTAFVPVDFDDLDEANYNQRFYGNYTTYSGFENVGVDAYYLGYDNQNANFSLHTLGMRLSGTMDDWLWEVEAAPQFGRQSGLGLDHAAGFATAGIGRKINKLPGGTKIWFYYDYASGESLGGPGQDFNAYNQLFPLAHKYLGFIDNVQRSNIESPNILITMKPGKKWNFLMWYYHFMSATDAPVNAVAGNTAAQNTSKDLGDELDIVLKYGICPRSNVLFGWSHFWAGNKIIGTNDSDLLYGQYTLNF